MRLILEPDEAWSILTLVVAQVLDQVELSDEGKAAIRRWRSDRHEGTVEVGDLTVALNEVLGTTLDEKTTRLIRRKGWYVSTKEQEQA